MPRPAAILLLLSLAACSPGPDADPQQLRSLAQETHGLVAIPVDGERREIPRRDWPPSVILLKPAHVFAARDGLYIPVDSIFTDGETGYFVARPGVTPPSSGDSGYKALGYGIYWYQTAS